MIVCNQRFFEPVDRMLISIQMTAEIIYRKIDFSICLYIVCQEVISVRVFGNEVQVIERGNLIWM